MKSLAWILRGRRGDAEHVKKVVSWVQKCDPLTLSADETARVLIFLAKSRCKTGTEKLIRTLSGKPDNTLISVANGLNSLSLLEGKINKQVTEKSIQRFMNAIHHLKFKDADMQTLTFLSRAAFDLSLVKRLLFKKNAFGETVVGAFVKEANHDKLLVKRDLLIFTEILRTLSEAHIQSGGTAYKEAFERFFMKNSANMSKMGIPMAASLLKSVQSIDCSPTLLKILAEKLTSLRIHTATDFSIARLLHGLASAQIVHIDLLSKLEVKYCSLVDPASTTMHSVAQSLWAFHSLQYRSERLHKLLLKKQQLWMRRCSIKDITMSIHSLVDTEGVSENDRRVLFESGFDHFMKRITALTAKEETPPPSPPPSEVVNMEGNNNSKTSSVLETLKSLEDSNPFDGFDFENSNTEHMPWDIPQPSEVPSQVDQPVSKDEGFPETKEVPPRTELPLVEDGTAPLPWELSIPESEDIDGLLRQALDDLKRSSKHKVSDAELVWKIEPIQKAPLSDRYQAMIDEETSKGELLDFLPIIVNMFGKLCPDSLVVKSLFNASEKLIINHFDGYSKSRKMLLLRGFGESSLCSTALREMLSRSYQEAEDTELSPHECAMAMFEFRRLEISDAIKSLTSRVERYCLKGMIESSRVANLVSACSACLIQSDIILSTVSTLLHNGVWPTLSKKDQESVIRSFTNLSATSKIPMFINLDHEIMTTLQSVTEVPKPLNDPPGHVP
eukprot:TRINITY_DN21014_c0_g1_i1.p1 TRINITY_DN21014_c0_g1~~TRINITY_DN21014_c0_g1_i1.p1  ORF type:complete len:728 (+),score=113.84 TRINITY_DN21014_c0_g1_i1:56-2239(+)